MRRDQGRYYLGRLRKWGRLDDNMVVEAIINSAIVRGSQYSWTITDAYVERTDGDCLFAYGQLSKFHPEGEVRVVDEEKRSQDSRIEPNLLVGTSPFVYIPEFSGIAFLHVWNKIEVKAFVRQFCRVIKASHGNFFVDCEVQLITDLQPFVIKLKSIEAFWEISAQVHPPNPLFGRAWQELRDYLERRKTSQLDIKEKAEEEGAPLDTKIVQHIDTMLQSDSYAPSEPIDIGDAAILMAADGYGKGKIVGSRSGAKIIVRTADVNLNFIFSKMPEPKKLYEKAYRHFQRVSNQRGMTHNEED